MLYTLIAHVHDSRTGVAIDKNKNGITKPVSQEKLIINSCEDGLVVSRDQVECE